MTDGTRREDAIFRMGCSAERSISGYSSHTHLGGDLAKVALVQTRLLGRDERPARRIVQVEDEVLHGVGEWFVGHGCRVVVGLVTERVIFGGRWWL